MNNIKKHKKCFSSSVIMLHSIIIIATLSLTRQWTRKTFHSRWVELGRTVSRCSKRFNLNWPPQLWSICWNFSCFSATRSSRTSASVKPRYKRVPPGDLRKLRMTAEALNFSSGRRRSSIRHQTCLLVERLQKRKYIPVLDTPTLSWTILSKAGGR